MSNKNLGIYIHIPFCNSKCPYCNFYSITSYNKIIIQNYVDKICENIKYWGNLLNHTVDTIYFGGGTPSILSSYFIIDIINTIKSSFNCKLDEVTIEVNPSDYNIIDFKLLKDTGVNRVSIGAQSINNDELNILKRKHNFYDIISTIKKCRKYNINNISLDLMLAIPYQNIEILNKSINFCIENNIPHISCYLLKLEKQTPFFNMKNSLNFLNDDEQANLYEFICEKLEENNYFHYEISNFCINNFQSKHNLKYWKCEDYLGIGSSAHSFINGKRFYYSSSIKDFLTYSQIIQDGIGGSVEEYCMLALRLSEGLNNDDFYNRFNRNIPYKYFERAQNLAKYGLVTCDNNKIKLTNKGFLLSNSIILNIIY